MKKPSDVIRLGGTWFEIIFRAEFRQYTPYLIVAEGSLGFARRNSKQTSYLDILAPPAGNPEQAAAFYLSDADANKLLFAGKQATQPAAKLQKLWLRCWENTIQRKQL